MEELIEKNVSELSDEEIIQELNKSKAADTGEPHQDVNASNQTTNDVPEQKQEADKSIDDKKAADEFVFDEKSYRDNGWKDDQIEILRKKERQLYEKEKFIHRQESEVAAARKKEVEIDKRAQELNQKLSMIQSNENDLKDRFYDDPDTYNKAIVEKQLAQRELDKLNFERKAIENQKIIFSNIPEFNELLSEEIPEIIKKDCSLRGIPSYEADNIIREVRNGGWAYEDLSIVLNIAEKARLLRENKRLQYSLRNISNSPDDVGRKIAQVANQRPIVQTSVSSDMPLQDPSNMTDAEIEAELRQYRQR